MKFFMTDTEVRFLKEMHGDLYEILKDKIETYLDPAEPYTPGLRRLAQESLGAQAVEYGYRVAPDQEVPGLRGLGVRPNTVYFDEAHNLSEIYDSGEPRLVTQKWVEHRRVCGRTLLECLSGETH